jgi:hypothetical protein
MYQTANARSPDGQRSPLPDAIGDDIIAQRPAGSLIFLFVEHFAATVEAVRGDMMATMRLAGRRVFRQRGLRE